MNIKKFRLLKNLTQLSLSREINVKRSTISMWENKKAHPNIVTLKKIAEVLDCTIDDLVKESD